MSGDQASKQRAAGQGERHTRAISKHREATAADEAGYRPKSIQTKIKQSDPNYNLRAAIKRSRLASSTRKARAPYHPVAGALLIFFALLGTFALFSRDEPLPNQAPPAAVEAPPHTSTDY
jgi:hypothetical protein